MNDAGDTTLFNYLSETDKKLSRTVINKTVSVTTSTKKRKALLDGCNLSSQIESNRKLACEYILWRRSSKPEQPADFFVSLVTLAELTGFKLFPEGVFRTWDYAGSHQLNFSVEQQIVPSSIGSSLMNLCQELQRKLVCLNDRDSRLDVIAAAEWEISVGPIHPFYDACGRISRYYATLLCLWLRLPLVERGDRETYFDYSNRGRKEFQRYFLECPRISLAFTSD